MPITQSAKKALRQSLRRRARNITQKKALKEVVKAYKKSPSAENLSLVYKKLDKAAKTNLIKKNKAFSLKTKTKKITKKKKKNKFFFFFLFIVYYPQITKSKRASSYPNFPDLTATS